MQSASMFFNIIMNKKILTIVFVVFTSFVRAQGFVVNNYCNNSKGFGFDFFIAARMRSTAMNFFNLRPLPLSIWIPYDYEKNIQTPAFGPKVAVYYERFGVNYTGFVRYGYLTSVFDTTRISLVRYQKKWLYDQQAHLSYAVNVHTRRRLAPRQVLAGYGSINTGKRFFLRNGPYNQYIDLQINTLDVGIGFEPLGPRWPITFTANYMYQGMASNRIDKFISYTLALEYRVARQRLGRLSDFGLGV